MLSTAPIRRVPEEKPRTSCAGSCCRKLVKSGKRDVLVVTILTSLDVHINVVVSCQSALQLKAVRKH